MEKIKRVYKDGDILVSNNKGRTKRDFGVRLCGKMGKSIGH